MAHNVVYCYTFAECAIPESKRISDTLQSSYLIPSSLLSRSRPRKTLRLRRLAYYPTLWGRVSYVEIQLLYAYHAGSGSPWELWWGFVPESYADGSMEECLISQRLLMDSLVTRGKKRNRWSSVKSEIGACEKVQVVVTDLLVSECPRRLAKPINPWLDVFMRRGSLKEYIVAEVLLRRRGGSWRCVPRQRDIKAGTAANVSQRWRFVERKDRFSMGLFRKYHGNDLKPQIIENHEVEMLEVARSWRRNTYLLIEYWMPVAINLVLKYYPNRSPLGVGGWLKITMCVVGRESWGEEVEKAVLGFNWGPSSSAYSTNGVLLLVRTGTTLFLLPLRRNMKPSDIVDKFNTGTVMSREEGWGFMILHTCGKQYRLLATIRVTAGIVKRQTSC